MRPRAIRRSAATSFFRGVLETVASSLGEKEDTSRDCGGYYRDRGDSRPTFEMTVLFSVPWRTVQKRAGDPSGVS